MSNSTYFTQECPSCGRRLQIRVEYLGRKVRCQHCGGQFLAIDPASARSEPAEQGNELLRRADELLESATHRHDDVRPRLYPR
jgi:hypothetical protein